MQPNFVVPALAFTVSRSKPLIRLSFFLSLLFLAASYFPPFVRKKRLGDLEGGSEIAKEGVCRSSPRLVAKFFGVLCTRGEGTDIGLCTAEMGRAVTIGQKWPLGGVLRS